jgi:hypothetical protein
VQQVYVQLEAPVSGKQEQEQEQEQEQKADAYDVLAHWRTQMKTQRLHLPLHLPLPLLPQHLLGFSQKFQS